jgi:hypothetical protein
MADKRYFAVIPQIGRADEMYPLAKEDMDKLYDTPRTSDVIGYPRYFDEDGRVWPIACEGCMVAVVK